MSETEAASGGWYTESPDFALRTTLAMDRVLHEARSDAQHILLFENAVFGRVLAIDGAVQVTERDEFIYHEMLVHPAVTAHGKAERVLVIGGGDGGALREVLKHPSVRNATLVEIDADVIAFSERWLPAVAAGAFQDPRTQIVIADGAAYVADGGSEFDVIIVDSTDPTGPGAALFAPGFYADCRRRLRPGGVLVTQSGMPFIQSETLRNTSRAFADIFLRHAFYALTAPSYTGGVMAIGMASDDDAPFEAKPETLGAYVEAADLVTRCYAPDMHHAALVLPPYIRALLANRSL